MKIIFVLLLFVSSFFSFSAQAKTADCLDSNTQQGLNDCTRGDLQLEERKLDALYQKIKALYAEDAVFLKKLKESQKAWMRYRDSQLEMFFPMKGPMADPKQVYGTVYPMCYATRKVDLVRARYQELKQWIDGVVEGEVCAGSVMVNSNAEKPPVPYYDYGACPFECCTYREWTSTKDTVLRKDFKDSSPMIGTVKAGEKVIGLTGVVITTKVGLVKILKPQSLTREDGKTKVELKPGDVIYNLRYVGEGFDKFWFGGQILVDQTDIRKIGKTEWWEVIGLPTAVWWVKIKRSNGKIGWTRDTENFQHMDSCE